MEMIQIATDVLAIGGGIVGVRTAKAVSDQGYTVHLVESSDTIGLMPESIPLSGCNDAVKIQAGALIETVRATDTIEIRTQTDVAGIAGVPGDFKVWLLCQDEVIEKQVGAVVLAPELAITPLNTAYGLDLNDTVISQSQLEADLRADPQKLAGKSVAFMVGFGQTGNLLTMERIFCSALTMSKIEGCTIYIYVSDLKVAADTLERLYLETRDKGVLYIKLKQAPAIELKDQGVTIIYTDSVLHREVVLETDIIVIEEALEVDPVNARLANMLRIDLGQTGFLQADNVHRFPVATNREGIFVVAGGRGVDNLTSAWMDAQNVALRIHALLGEGNWPVSANKAEIDTDKCAFCLTCYRCCPHGAIYWESDDKPVISPVACQGCGICTGECPMDAIQVGEFNDAAMHAQIASGISSSSEGQSIIAFCCQNSAMEAGAMAREFKMNLPDDLQMVQVPCAGTVDLEYILAAFAQGAASVLVMGCHNGNCKSELGNSYAQWRVKDARRRLAEIGLDETRLAFIPIAANMGSEFARMVRQMLRY